MQLDCTATGIPPLGVDRVNIFDYDNMNVEGTDAEVATLLEDFRFNYLSCTLNVLRSFKDGCQPAKRVTGTVQSAEANRTASDECESCAQQPGSRD